MNEMRRRRKWGKGRPYPHGHVFLLKMLACAEKEADR